ncbi:MULTISPECIES: EamA family transporter RarD [Vibrio]|uniref:EamA family transporter RarD n=1 Tax=Vibrio casei TaxID=673372 RepID=A0A368LGR6_9VIBR|nr:MULTISPECIES: EamA family transporter RarD [Vibrio]RCS69223.1 EamA family transporter RarD [Vibrio casei]SJN37955.1 Protein rarD [Vibrio casei]HBV76248.1 EamA family transporter RarD [Vibrio sp.]
MDDALKRTKQGVLLAIIAYIMWGIAPIYFKALGDVPPFEILCHRVIWSFIFLAILLYVTKGWQMVKETLRSKTKVIYLLITSITIGINWLVFIWAISIDHMLDASLGYYINPLFNVILGMIFLNEKLRKLQWFAVTLASIGVIVQLVVFGSVPIIAIVLAFSFGIYGLLRKKVNLDAFTGLFIETLVLLPVAFIYLFAFADTATSHLTNNSMSLNVLLISAGIVTTLPLLCFAGAAVRLRLATLGFIQYIGPSLMFLLAVFVYGEAFTPDKIITFAFIWAALVVFTWDGLNNNSNNKRLAAAQRKEALEIEITNETLIQDINDIQTQNNHETK